MNSTRRSWLWQLFIRLAFIMCFADGVLLAQRAVADNDESSQRMRSAKISTIGYVTWWSHDAIGYHPAIYLKLENNSSFDLSGVIVHLQARFTDLRNGYVTVARMEKRRDFLPHQQISLMLRGPKAWELPIDLSAWPAIECKVMCRVGDVGDEGTQDLGVTRLEQITMTDDEALAQLTAQTGVGRVSRLSQRDPDQSHLQRHDRVEHALAVPAKALMATAGSLLGPKTSNKNEAEARAKKISGLDIQASLPALGDDFYVFEKFFGLPAGEGIVPSKNDLTWVQYPGKNFFEQVFVGSKASSGKADLIIVTIPTRLLSNEVQLLAMAKLLAGKSGGKQNIAPLTHSVRYLSTGRLEILRTSGQNFHVLALILPKTLNQDSLVLVVSRLPGDPEALLVAYGKKIAMLAFLLPGLASQTN